MARPTGTVTLLFTDIEGSTSLWERAPTSMAVALERHEALVRAAVEANDGFVFKTVGDAFCIAFAVGASAAQAALEAQLALASEPWPAEAPIRVRMALHTGACQEREDDYFGPTVNRAARLMGVANGGQVLASGATAALLGDLATVTMRDLGLHRLRDLGRPEQVYQLTTSGLREEFPPLHSLDNPDLPNNLPALLSPFLGREHELDELRAHVAASRLVTLTGAGGAGKTRLAVQAAAELLDGSGDGVWLVELAPITDESQVVPAIAAAYGLQEALGTDPLEALLRSLAAQRALLVIDNCEHLVDRVAKVVDAILRGCPGVHVLATSREPLGVDGERVYRVPSMSLPTVDVERLADAATSDAVAFFVTRAQDAGARVDDDDGALVVSVCRRLDGIPLALELAAARLSSMSLVQLSDRLDQRFRLLTGGSRSAMARQQTLQALVDWSYGLLNPTEQQLLQRLSVFVGGFELEAAESVCAGGDVDELDVLNLLHSLVEKSLVVADQDAGSLRYRLLETIRQYGAAELLRAAGDEGVLALRERHADYFVALAARAGAALSGPAQDVWLSLLDLEVDNLRTCIAHLAGQPDRTADALGLVVNLERFVLSRGLVEVLPIAIALLERSEDDELTARACIVVALGIGMLLTGDHAEVARSEPIARRGLEIAQRLGLAAIETRATGYLALVASYNNDVQRAGDLMADAVERARALDDGEVRDQVLAWSLMGRFVQAREATLEERRRDADALLASAQQRRDLSAIALSYSQLATLSIEEGDDLTARQLYESAIALGEQLGAEEALTATRNNLTMTLLTLGVLEEAQVQLRRCIRYARLSGYRNQVGDLIFAGAVIVTSEGDAVRGARLLGAADELRRDGYATGQLVETEGEARMREATTAVARASLGDERFERERALGLLLGPPEACDLVLGRGLESSRS